MTKVILDFNDLDTGEVVNNQFQTEGVTIFSIVNGVVNPSGNPPMIFDTANPTGGDHDLATNNLGKALIISEDGDSSDPDDNGDGGVLCFDFDDTVTMHKLTLLDIEEGARIKLWDDSGNVIYSKTFTGGNNQQKIVDFGDVEGVARMDIVLHGSAAVDNIAYTTAAPGLDGTVEGTGGSDLIDVAYTGDPEGDRIDNDDAILPGDTGDDDLVFAFGGNDTVIAGNGDDEVYGGTGHDTLIGDGGNEIARESFEWDRADDDDAEDGFTQNTGTVTVTYSNTKSTGDHEAEIDDDTDLNVSGIDDGDETIDDESALNSETDGQGNQGDFRWEFSAPVTNVQFNVNDIDGDGVVRITAYGADGKKIPVELEGGSRLTLLDTDSVAGADTADSQGGYLDPDTNPYNLQVTIPGPVSKIVLEHDQNGPANSGIWVTDIYFDAIVGPGDEGNDTLFGEDGNDILEGDGGDDGLFGGDGRDTIDGGEGDDEIDGGTGRDSILGGRGNDSIEGGTGNDVIDAGNKVDPLPDVAYPGLYGADANPNNDRDFVDGGDGNDTIFTGDDDDTILGGDGNDVIDAGIDDDTVEGNDGDDTIIGGEGNDEIDGGDGDDLIYGGLDDSVPDVVNIPDDGSGPFGPDLVTDNNNDVISGGDGNDTIFGRDDGDTLFGDAGEDFLDGGVDDDVVFGGDDDDTIIGGQGADTLSGGDDRDTFLGGNGGDDVDGGSGGDDFDTLDLTGSDVDFITYTSADREDGIVTFLDGSTMTFEEIENVIPCFTPGTLIATPRGERLVEELKEGDRIITRDNGIQEIRWVGHKKMKGVDLVRNPHLKPILIKAGALGGGLPERDTMVSPNHRLLISGDQSQLYFEEREVLAAAKHMVGSDGIVAVDVMSTTYIHFMFDRHEVVLSNGAWTESFQPGDYSLKGIGGGQRAEIFELFPELKDSDGRDGYTAARKVLKKHEAKLLSR